MEEEGWMSRRPQEGWEGRQAVYVVTSRSTAEGLEAPKHLGSSVGGAPHQNHQNHSPFIILPVTPQLRTVTHPGRRTMDRSGAARTLPEDAVGNR